MLQANKKQHEEAVDLVLSAMRTMEANSKARGGSWEDNARAAEVLAELANTLDYTPETEGE